MAGVGALLVALLAAIAIGAFANDPDMLQDVCVADPTSGILMNGFPCKNITMITPEDFFLFARENHQQNPWVESNRGKYSRHPRPQHFRSVDGSCGLCSLPHIHPRASEIIFVLEGELHVAFITTGNKLISKVVKAGEVFVFPRGLAHYQKNMSKYPTSVIAAFNSQLPGTQQFAAALFTSTPPVSNHVLAQTFNINEHKVEMIRNGLAPK